ncbi:MAG: class I SAM-dependent methyltransferase [Patescibacteria group bacterium]|nr:class I SAM-dependent methyltransferase [Patescibacteria group bacterium]
MRNNSYGQTYNFTLIDKLGIYLSTSKIVGFVKRERPKRIIDIGCGYNAVLLQQLRGYSSDLTGIDIKTNKKINGIKFIDKKITTNLSFLKSNSADLIVINSVLEHLSNPEIILKEIYRILDKNGNLILNVPSWRGKFFLELSAFKLGLSPKEEMDDHKMYYDKKDLWPLLVKAGFKPSNIRVQYHKLYINTIAYAKK